MGYVSGKKVLPLLGVAGLAYFCVALYIAKDLGGPARAFRAQQTADAGVGVMSEEERGDYLKESVKVENFAVRASPDANGFVEVQGVVRNVGPKPLHAAKLVVRAIDADGRIRATHQEDVLGPSRLDPGQARPFGFRLPAQAEGLRFEPMLQ